MTETSGQWEIGEQLEEAQMNAEGGGRFDREGGKMVSIYYQTIVDYTWRTDPDDANVDEWRVQDEVEDKIKDEMHIGDSSYGTFYAYDNETHESIQVSYSWDKTIEEDDEEIIKSWAETDESLQAEDYDEDWSDPYEHFEPSCEPCWEYGDYDAGMAPAADHICEECEVLVCDGCYDSSTQMCLECVSDKEELLKVIQIEQGAEGKKRKRISGALSDPFDELSLDSGGIKSIVVGIGIGLLACVGYNKWK